MVQEKNNVSMLQGSQYNGKNEYAIYGDEFSNNGLMEFLIPTTVTWIGRNAFSNNQLTEIIIPDSVETIMYGAFSYNKLYKIQIGSNVEYYENPLTFDTSYTFGDYGESFSRAYQYNNRLAGIYTYNESTGYWSYNNVEIPIKPTEYFIIIPNGTVTIEEGSYDFRLAFTVEFPEGLTTIGDRALSGNRFTTLEIPKGVVSIGEMAFSFCRIENLILPDSITSIGKEAFYYNHLSEIVLPNNITSLGLGVFSGNYLTKITIGDNVEFEDYKEPDARPDEASWYFPTFGHYHDEFKYAYKKNNRSAGTYIYNDESRTWIYENQ
jgi:hypothetical protein